MKKHRNPQSIHPPLGAYTHQIEIRGPERLLALSGQLGMTPDGRVPDDATEQLDVALANVLRNLDAADMDVTDLVKMTVYLTESIDMDTRRAIYAERLADHAPCITLIYVAGLATPELKVEVDAWASAEPA